MQWVAAALCLTFSVALLDQFERLSCTRKIRHIRCISCVAVICQAEANTWKHMCFTRSELRGLTQFIRFFPAIRLELDFDNMWKTRFEEMAGAMRFEREASLKSHVSFEKAFLLCSLLFAPLLALYIRCSLQECSIRMLNSLSKQEGF